jgi:hypothetical protein
VQCECNVSGDCKINAPSDKMEAERDMTQNTHLEIENNGPLTPKNGRWVRQKGIQYAQVTSMYANTIHDLSTYSNIVSPLSSNNIHILDACFFLAKDTTSWKIFAMAARANVTWYQRLYQ